MTYASSIPNAVDAIVALIQGRPELSGVQVVDGFPGTWQGNDIVTVGGSVDPVVDGAQNWASLGRKRVRENYAIEVIITVNRGLEKQKDSRDAAFGYYNAIAQGVLTDPTLGGVVYWALPGPIAVKGTDYEMAAQGSRTEITTHIECVAEIVP